MTIMEAKMPARCHGSQLVTYYDNFHPKIFNVVPDQIIVELNKRFAE